MRQPVVRTHPQTGRPSLYVSPRFTLRIEGVSQERSDLLLAEIFALAEEARFHYRHEWRDNDLVIWDNRCLNHRVRFFPTNDVRRRLRVTVAGDRPFYVPPALACTTGMVHADERHAQKRGAPELIAAA